MQKFLLRLSHSVRPSRRLQIILRVEIRIQEDHRISCHQIQAETASSCAQQETKRFRRDESLNSCESLLASNGTVQSFVRII